MSSIEKNQSFFKKLRAPYRFAIFNEQTYEELFVIRLSKLNVVTLVGVLSIGIIVFVSFLIAFTSLKEYIPGYPDANQRLLIVRNAQRVDSLLVEINKRDKFINSFQAIMRGDTPDSVSQAKSEPTDHQVVRNDAVDFVKSEEDSLFRLEIENEERFNLSVRKPSSKIVALENTFFFSPIKGLVVSGFGEVKGHYGVDVVSVPGSRVSAVLDGVVIFSGWTVETGYVIEIQHHNNLISMYKHNQNLLKEVGEVVKAGEAIASVGNSGELTSGPHLHFELWYNGTPLNPVEYISF
jgi:murein DD-endopeptidase MepM/ murein hydrolase activator NlpD